MTHSSMNSRAGWLACFLFVSGCASQVDPEIEPDGGTSALNTGGATLNSGGTSTYSTGGTPVIPAGGSGGGGVSGTGGTVGGSGGTGGTTACTIPILCPATGGTTGTGGATAGGGVAGAASGGTGGAVSCDNAVCFDIFDCALWHPDMLNCGFTKCEGFVCKK